MYTFKSMPGSSGLSGVMDMFNAKAYWTALKGKIAELQALGPQISIHQQNLGVARYNLLQRGDQVHAALLDDEIKKVQDDLDKWWKVKGYIDQYLPDWMQIDQNVSVGPTSGVGFVFILAGMALIALAYTVNTGMALLQDYQYKKMLTTAVIEQKMTSGQAAEILSVPRQEGVLETVVGKVGVGLGFGIPTALLVVGGAYLLFASGMLKGLLGGGSSSGGTQS